MKMNIIMKLFKKSAVAFGFILLAGALVFGASPAFAAGNGNGYIKAAGSHGGSTFVSNEAGAKLATGSLLQFIYAGADGIISPPDANGNPTGDDTLIQTGTIGTPWSTAGEFFYFIDNMTDNAKIYVRAWNAASVATATQYGDSAVYTINGGSPKPTPFTWNVPNFATISNKPTPVSLAVSTTSLLGGNVGTAYSQTLAATGGTTPYTWTLSSGNLPAGLSLNSSTGVISGTPTTAQTYNFTVQVSGGGTATKALSIVISNNPPSPLTISTTSLSNGTVGTSYNQTLQATGGVGSYTWSLNGTTLPAGLSLNSSTGVISGTPTASGTTTNITIQVTDSASPPNTTFKANLSITINAAGTPTITTTSLPGGTVGTPYYQTLTATGGTQPYTWSVQSNALPAGLTLSAAGVISGTPTTVQTNSFYVQLTDAAAHSATPQSLAISITAAPTPTAIVIDDFEGGCVGTWSPVTAGGYYTFQDGMVTPNNNNITSQGPNASAAKNGTKGMKVMFSYVPNADSTKDWGDGWGAQLTNVLNLSAMQSVTMNVKWDGSANQIKFGFQDSQGHVSVATIANSDLMALGSSYAQISIPVGSFAEDTTNPSRVPGAIDWTHITNYNFAYLNKGTTTNYQYIDDITAQLGNVIPPNNTVISLSQGQGPVGTALTVNWVSGRTFGTTQGNSQLTFTNKATGVSTPNVSITSWSDNQIKAIVPSLPLGAYDVKVAVVQNVSGTVQTFTSDPASFSITSNINPDTPAIYPNPFNPPSETVTIAIGNTKGATTIDYYIYDMTARLIKHFFNGGSQITWGGLDDQGNLAGNGAYLVRIVNADTKALIAKGKLLVVKH
jgi:Putative Ig domain